MTYRLFVLLMLWPGLVLSQGQQDESNTSPPPAESRLDRAVRTARDQGENTLELPHLVTTPVRITSLADAAARYTFVVASPIDHIVVADERAMSLTTWYKFRATKVLAYAGTRPPIHRRRNTAYEQQPGSLSPLGPMDFLRPSLGGKTLIDGVEVNSPSNTPNRFDEQDSYLMIVDFDNETGKIASLPYGAYGLFRLDGDNLQPAVPQSSSSLAQEIRTKYNRSFKALESAFRRNRARGL